MTVAAALWVLGVVCGSAALVPVGAAPSPGPGPGTSSGAGPAPTPVLAFGYATPRVPSAFETGGGRISEDRQLLASTQGNLRHAEDINFDARDRDSNALGGSPARAPAPTQGAAEQAPQCEGDAEDALFPGELFDQTQLRHGAVIIYFIFAFYGFLVIAMVCENYFLPTVEIICEELGLSPDVAGATFMSLASSAPELFVNVVTTFVTKSTMGVGTTVGSATFNVLGLASFIGLASRAPIQIRAGPVVRDSLMYVSAIAITTCVVMDGSVEWYEALAMVLCSLAYMLFMFSQHRLARWARSLVSRSNSTIVLTTPKHGTTHDDESASADSVSTVDVSAVMSADPNAAAAAAAASPHCDTAKEEPQGQGCVGCLRRFSERFWLVVTWPVSFALAHTIIDSKKPKMRPFFFLTFILCVVWIALAAYVVSWMLAVIGNTLGISDSVMGITLLAAGGSTPEAVSAIIMSRKGVGSVGIANGLGANTLNMLMNLGMPWLVRSLTEPGKPWTVLSRGLTFDLVALVSAVGALNLILLLSRYRLGRSQGVCTFGVYLLFIVMLCLIELNVFGWLPPLNCSSS